MRPDGAALPEADALVHRPQEFGRAVPTREDACGHDSHAYQLPLEIKLPETDEPPYSLKIRRTVERLPDKRLQKTWVIWKPVQELRGCKFEGAKDFHDPFLSLESCNSRIQS